MRVGVQAVELFRVPDVMAFKLEGYLEWGPPWRYACTEELMQRGIYGRF